VANTLLTIGLITREALRVLENSLTFTKQINTQYDDRFAVDGAKIGTILNVRKPPQYVGRVGQALAIEDSTETQVPVELDTQFGVDIQFSSQDLALSIDDFRDRFIKPAIATVSNRIDRDGLLLSQQVWNTVGAPGTTPVEILVYLTAGVRLDDDATPMDGSRCVVITPLMQATLVDALKGLFQQASEIAAQYRKGAMGTAAGFEFYMDQNVTSHTVGPLGGTPTVNGAGQTGSAIITQAWTSSASRRLNRGDVITFADVLHVNPQSRQTNGQLQQFVVTSNFDSDGSGDGTVNIDPPITTSGAFQTVDSSPANAAAILTFGEVTSTQNTVTPQGLAFHKDAFTLASADLPLPRGVDMAARVADKQLGLSIRMVRAYDINQDQFPCRLDILYGWAALRPELACRIAA
jgi:hypothetical protein